MPVRTGRGSGSEGRMSLGQHLIELRKRLSIAAIAFVVASVGGFFVADWILRAIRAPIELIAKTHGNTTLNYSTIGAAFDVHIQIAITVGVIASCPVWLYQIFAFIVPGLSKKERHYTFGFFFASVPLFFAGCAAGWWVFPHLVDVLNSFVPSQDAAITEAKDYLGFVTKLVLAVGIAFILPVFLVLLNFLGIVSGVAIFRSWRWAILAIFVFCALATPAADVGSMFLLAAPMIVLYLLAATIAWWRDRLIAKRTAALSADIDRTVTT